MTATATPRSDLEIQALQQTSNPDRVVPTRRVSFEEHLSQIPRHFAGTDRLIQSHLIAALSSVFPDGEDYFVRSVRHFRSEISDPTLRKQVAGFIGQESVHGREHRALNERLHELGYPTRRSAKVADTFLRIRERVTSPKSNLAVTAALEHFTATLAELILSDENARAELGHPAVADLFVWHALEESEHKAVAFDVYRAVGGGERMRVWTMKGIRFGFVFFTVVTVLLSLMFDRESYRPGQLRKSWRQLRRSPLMTKELIGRLKEYDRPEFHPDDRDTDGLVAEWRESLFGDDGSLRSLLAGADAVAS